MELPFPFEGAGGVPLAAPKLCPKSPQDGICGPLEREGQLCFSLSVPRGCPSLQAQRKGGAMPAEGGLGALNGPAAGTKPYSARVV